MSVKSAREKINSAMSTMYHCSSGIVGDSTREELIHNIESLASDAWCAIGYLNDACDDLGIPHWGEQGREEER